MITVLADSFHVTAANIVGLVTGLIVAVAGVLTTAFALRSSVREARSSQEAEKTQKTLEDRLGELSTSMRNSAELAQQISAELDARAAAAKKLIEEAQAAKAVADISKDQAEGMRRLIDTELEATARRVRRDSIIISLGSFIAGGGVSFLITLLVHPLH